MAAIKFVNRDREHTDYLFNCRYEYSDTFICVRGCP